MYIIDLRQKKHVTEILFGVILIKYFLEYSIVHIITISQNVNKIIMKSILGAANKVSMYIIE